MKTLNVLDGAVSVVRDGVVLLDPSVIVANPEFNGRRFEPGNLDELIKSILDTRGNQQAVLVRRDTYNNPVLVFGFRRLKAILQINENKLWEGLTEGPFRIKAEIEDLTEDAAFESNVRENAPRENLTDIDRAYIAKRLKDQGRPQKEIARLLSVSDATISQSLRLLELPVKIQKMIHKGPNVDGGISKSTAFELLDLPEGDRESALAELTAGGKKVTSRKVRAAAEKKGVKAKRKNAPEKEKSKRRGVKEVREFWETMALADGNDTAEAQARRDFSREVVRFMDGKQGDKALGKKLDAVFGVEKSEKEAAA